MSQQPFNEVKASSLAGVLLDCDLSTGAKIGGGTATDNTTALNAFLATASATNPIHLILDGPTSVTGLSIAPVGRTKISGIGRGSGIFIKSGSNADPINNGKLLPEDNPGTPPASGAFVELRNFEINGNRGNGTTGNSNSGNPRGVPSGPTAYWYCNINFSNIVGVVIEDMYIYDASTYGIRLNNCSDVVIAFNTINNPNATAGFNNDCIHVDGPATDIRIHGNYLTNNNSDDCIAINPIEGYAGVVDRVVITGNTMVAVFHGLALRGDVAGQLGSVVFSNNSGSVLSAVILANSGNGGNTTDLSVRSLVASSNTFSITTGGHWLEIVGGTGDVTLTDCTWLSPVANGAFIGGVSPGGGTVASITVNHCRIYRTVAGNNTSITMAAANATLTINKLVVNGFYVVNEQGQSYAAMAELLAMTNLTITQLFIAALDYTNIALLADAYTNIGSISGAWQPESNIQSKAGAYTLLPTDRTILGNTTAAGFAVALPAKSYAGQKHTVKNTGTANTLTITGTVDSAVNPTLTTLAKMTIEYDGTNWWSV